MLRHALLALVLLVPSVALAGESVAADRGALLKGIEALDRPGVPGNLVVFGDDAFAIVTGGKRPEPVVAATRFGKGRAVAMAHSGYLDASVLPNKSDSRGQLLRNALAWVAPGKDAARVRIFGRDAHLAAALTAAGFVADEGGVPVTADDVDLIIWKNGTGDENAAAAIAAFVDRGGGLISAACPWGWAQIRAKQGLTVRDDLPENHALRAMGIVYADGTTDGTRDGRYAIDLSRPDDAHAGVALADLIARAKGATKRTYLVERALRGLPDDDAHFLPAVEEAIASVDATRAPRPGAPLGKKDPLARLAVTVRSLRWRDANADEVGAFPGAESFPGAVPADAPRIERTFTPDPTIAGWQGTGLYLAPGEVLDFHAVIDPSEHALVPTGWRLRIGCHTDKLWKKDRWERWPEITHTVPLLTAKGGVATPWGGPVYLEALANAKPISVRLAGAVAAPRFVLGDEENESSWSLNRLAPGPWAEIEGKNMVLSVPSAVVRALDDPKRVAEFWDAVLASHCDLAATPLPRRRERFVPDVQISLGYMHSGYPIMMHLDTVTPPTGTPQAATSPTTTSQAGRALAPLLDIDARTETSSWGYFHELGHNRQRGWWTFRGTTEVTCNLFSLYTHETLCGVEPWTNPWLQSQKKKAKPYLASGAPFEQWRRQPGLALLVYAQIQREFGWEPFTTVFRDYEEGPAADRPSRDQDKIDQFVVRLSRAAKHDLRPVWKRWGAPLSDWVMKDPEVGKLPVWMPDFDDFD